MKKSERNNDNWNIKGRTFEKWKDFSMKEKCGILICFGIVLLLISVQWREEKENLFSVTETKTKTLKQERNKTEIPNKSAVSSLGSLELLENYRENLENQMEQMLMQMDGVGKAYVCVTLKKSGTVELEKDKKTSEKRNSIEDGENGKQVVIEQEIEESTLSYEDENGIQNPAVREETLPEVEGVVVVCDGGNKTEVVVAVTKIMQALFHIEPHKIVVAKRSSG